MRYFQNEKLNSLNLLLNNKKDDPGKLKRIRKNNDSKEMDNLSKALSSLVRTVFKNPSEKTGYYGRTKKTNSSSFNRMQNCVAKVRYGNDKAKHIKFLKEYLTQLHKKNVIEKPEVFSSDEITPEYLSWYQENMEDKFFKIIVSPENQNIDMETFIKTLMKKLEEHQKRKFYWFGSVHRDTEHVHAHILINGRDKAGKVIEKLDSKFISYDIRSIAREVCTDLLGYRTEEEIKREAEKLYTRNRVTVLDEQLLKLEKKEQSPLDDFESVVSTLNSELLKRLDHLCNLGLCVKSRKNNSYRLEKNWFLKLRAMGRYNAFLKARKSLKNTDYKNLMLATEDSGVISGSVTQLYKMNDEDIWTHGIVVENKELNKAWYVPLFYEPKDWLKDCDVTIKLKPNNKGLLTPNIHINQYPKMSGMKK